MSQLLKGAPVASKINEDTARRAEKLRQSGITPRLVILRVGEKPDDIYYENAAMKRCAGVGVDTDRVTMPSDISQDALIREVRRLNEDESVHGMLILRPLPRQIDDEAVREILLPEKDVDGITGLSLAGVFTGSGRGFAPCTAEACMEILDHYGVSLSGARTAVIGRSLVIGKPVAMLLVARNATVTICHTRTKDIPSIIAQSDIVVSAAGKIGTVKADMLSSKQVVIDVGMNTDEAGNLCGDVELLAAEVAAAVTPVPGGVGSVTTALLARHVVAAAEKSV